MTMVTKGKGRPPELKDSDLLEKMTAMENRALMWQADLDQELQRLNTEISQVLQDTAPSPAAEQLALWRKELRQTRQFLVETLKLLTEKDAETLLDTKQPKEDVTRAKLARREMELQQREEALQVPAVNSFGLLDTKQPKEDVTRAKLARREMELQQREEALQAKEKKLQMVKDQERQPAFSSALLAKEREFLDFKDKQLLEREQALQREKQLQQDREHSFHAREKLLLDRELTLQEEKKLHQERERQQQEREESLQAQRKLQQEREESLDAKDRQLRSAPAPVVPAPEAAKAPRRAPKRKAEPPAKGPPLPQNRSSRSRERVEEDKRPKTKRRKVPYVTFEELRWDWLKSHSPEVLAVPAETVEELDLLQALKAPQRSVPSELPWDTDLMVELDEVAPPQPISADAELMVELEEAPPEFREAPAPVKPKPQAEIEESYLVDGLTEEDLFDVEEEAAAEYMPPSPKMNAKKPPPEVRSPVLAESEAPGAAAAAGAAKNKKKDWYQRHYPGQVAPREQRETSQRWQRPRQNGFKPPGRAGAAVPRPQELDWAYEPLKGQSKTNDGLFPQLSDSLPSIDDVLPSL